MILKKSSAIYSSDYDLSFLLNIQCEKCLTKSLILVMEALLVQSWKRTELGLSIMEPFMAELKPESESMFELVVGLGKEVMGAPIV